MNSIGNLLWLILGGIPFGILHFRMAINSLFPFGKEVR